MYFYNIDVYNLPQLKLQRTGHKQLTSSIAISALLPSLFEANFRKIVQPDFYYTIQVIMLNKCLCNRQQGLV